MTARNTERRHGDFAFCVQFSGDQTSFTEHPRTGRELHRLAAVSAAVPLHLNDVGAWDCAGGKKVFEGLVNGNAGIAVDVEQSNGVIHVIDTVLIPAS